MTDEERDKVILRIASLAREEARERMHVTGVSGDDSGVLVCIAKGRRMAVCSDMDDESKQKAFQDMALPYQADELARLRERCDHLERFKAYVHGRLDAAGVPADPESTHKAEGCRIGGRLDLVLARWAEKPES